MDAFFRLIPIINFNTMNTQCNTTVLKSKQALAVKFMMALQQVKFRNTVLYKNDNR